eukprot:6851737-Prymnesium_polylepis.1
MLAQHEPRWAKHWEGQAKLGQDGPSRHAPPSALLAEAEPCKARGGLAQVGLDLAHLSPCWPNMSQGGPSIGRGKPSWAKMGQAATPPRAPAGRCGAPGARGGLWVCGLFLVAAA